MTAAKPEPPSPKRQPYPTTHPEPARPVPPPRTTKSPTRIAALEALMDPRDIAASDRLIAAAPPLTPGQIAALRSLLQPATEPAHRAA